jgi:hypothetical protein
MLWKLTMKKGIEIGEKGFSDGWRQDRTFQMRPFKAVDPEAEIHRLSRSSEVNTCFLTGRGIGKIPGCE